MKNPQDYIAEFRENMLSGWASQISQGALNAVCEQMKIDLTEYGEQCKEEQKEKDAKKAENAGMHADDRYTFRESECRECAGIAYEIKGKISNQPTK